MEYSVWYRVYHAIKPRILMTMLLMAMAIAMAILPMAMAMAWRGDGDGDIFDGEDDDRAAEGDVDGNGDVPDMYFTPTTLLMHVHTSHPTLCR